MTSDDAQPKKRVGRPRKYPGTERRPTLTFRVTDDLYEKLKGAAAVTGLSLSEQIERQLERSFNEYQIIEEAKRIEADRIANNAIKDIGGKEGAMFARIFGRIAQVNVLKIGNKYPNSLWWLEPDKIKELKELMSGSEYITIDIVAKELASVNRSIHDIAAELGIDHSGMDRSQILRKLKDKLDSMSDADIAAATEK